MGFATKQIYTIVNDVNSQVTGKDEISVVDTSTFVSLGRDILNSQDYTENFMNALVMRIARTIVSYRKYNMLLKPLVFDDIRWGAIVQKLKVEMPEAVSDDAYDLVDGQSVDMYVVRKPKVHQKMFVTRTPYSFFVTIQRWQIKRAFLSEETFGAFISAVFGEIQNKLELTFESLGYMCMANFVGNTQADQRYKLLTMYNNETSSTLTPAQASRNPDFLRFAISMMNTVAFKMQSISRLYNAEGYDRHTPYADQRFIIPVDFNERMKSVVQYEAFHKEYVSKAASVIIPHWQNPKEPLSIQVTDENGKDVSIDNLIGFIHDRDALGTYRKEEETLTTPVNARGRYTNTFYHEEQMWFNDLSENGVIFTLD